MDLADVERSVDSAIESIRQTHSVFALHTHSVFALKEEQMTACRAYAD